MVADERSIASAFSRTGKRNNEGRLGEAELALAASFCAPLYWVNRIDARQIEVKNGGAFFLDAGDGPFGVTARTMS
jgi:hypothetical protein